MTKTLRAITMSRKARFRAAVALGRTTAKAWCEEQGFTEGHLYQVLRGERISPATMKRVDAFIAKQLGEELGAA